MTLQKFFNSLHFKIKQYDFKFFGNTYWGKYCNAFFFDSIKKKIQFIFKTGEGKTQGYVQEIRKFIFQSNYSSKASLLKFKDM
ncbi:hypothetical protein IW22_04150 [Chryseobacterium sp. JM1]|nr:hypothetical protein IW22_04150 [Chryseobacterium sp. JM1]